MNESPSLILSSQRKLGLSAAVGAAFFSAAMGVCILMAGRADSELSSSMSAFIRVLVTGILICFVLIFRKPKSPTLGNARCDLMLWGLFGGLTVMTYFWSISKIGVGQVNLYQGLQVLVSVLLGPVVLGQRNRIYWPALLLLFFGLWIMSLSALESEKNIMGTVVGISSGLFCGLAYLYAAKAARLNDTITLSLYWFLVCFAVVSLVCILEGVKLPDNSTTLIWLILSGVFAAAAQGLTIVSLRFISTDLVLTLGFLSVFFGMTFDIFIFGETQTMLQIFGVLCIVLSSLALSFRSKTLKNSQDRFSQNFSPPLEPDTVNPSHHKI